METNFAAHDYEIGRVAIELNLTRESARIRFRDCMCFLKMCAGSRLRLAPTPEMDEVWHVLLQNEISYCELCTQEFGCIIAHEAGQKKDSLEIKQAILNSRVTARKMFGADFAELWLPGDSASCCSSCSHVVVEYRAPVT
jgi:hypothetical protein